MLSGMAARRRTPRFEAITERAAVTPLELFFDLVFVFALTQVTALLADDPTVRGLVRGALLLSVLWWCWVGYSWLGNLVQADEGVVRAAMFAGMATMFVAALAIPEAFEDRPGGLSGPVVFAACYLVFRVLHLGLLWAAGAGDPGLRRQLLRFVPSLAIGTSLLLAAAATTGAVQLGCWVAALAGDYLGTIAAGASGWRLRSPGHFAERHGLIVIVALGESIVSIGVGVAQVPVSWPIVAGSVLGLAVAAALWWAYFDLSARLAEQALGRARGEARNRLGRDAYSYLHLPMVIGIIFASLGLKKVLGSVGGPDDGYDVTGSVTGIPAVALYGGAALYLLGHVAFTYRALGTVRSERVAAAGLLVALTPLVPRVPALAALAMLVVVLTLLIGYETVRYAPVRERVRHEGHQHHAGASGDAAAAPGPDAARASGADAAASPSVSAAAPSASVSATDDQPAPRAPD
jgi:low temperature requirement protein LtrA